MVPPLGNDKFARLAKRLASRPDRSDLGQLLPATASALEAATVKEQLSQLVTALASERVVVPVPVEAHPKERGDKHSPQDLDESATIPLATDTRGDVTAIAVFSSAAALAAWDPEARPMTMGAQKAAITAIAAGIPRFRLDPNGAALLIPRPAVEALAGGGSWLPAWEDAQLQEELGATAKQLSASWADFADVTVDYQHEIVEVVVSVVPSVDEAQVRGEFAALLNELGKNLRLSGAAETVRFTPRIVAGA